MHRDRAPPGVQVHRLVPIGDKLLGSSWVVHQLMHYLELARLDAKLTSRLRFHRNPWSRREGRLRVRTIGVVVGVVTDSVVDGVSGVVFSVEKLPTSVVGSAVSTV